MTVIGIDVGGTKTLIALISSTGVVTDRIEHPTRESNDHIARVAELTGRALERWAAEDIRALAAGFPEYVIGGRLNSREVLSWQQQPSVLLAQELTAHGRNIPVVIESDVRLGALGEAVFGAGSKLPSFVYVSLGTGLSTCLVLDGVCWSGQRGEAIALGEWSVSDPLFTGNLEQYASGAGIAARYAAAGTESPSTRDIVARSTRDSLAREVLLSAGTELGAACAALVSVLDPAAIILGGGLGSAETPVTEALRAEFSRRMRRPDAPPLLTARNGPDAGVIGAAAAHPSIPGDPPPSPPGQHAAIRRTAG